MWRYYSERPRVGEGRRCVRPGKPRRAKMEWSKGWRGVAWRYWEGDDALQGRMSRMRSSEYLPRLLANADENEYAVNQWSTARGAKVHGAVVLSGCYVCTSMLGEAPRAVHQNRLHASSTSRETDDQKG